LRFPRLRTMYASRDAAGAKPRAISAGRTGQNRVAVKHDIPTATAQPIFSYVRSAHGTYLCVDRHTRQIRQSGELDSGLLPIMFCEFEVAACHGFSVCSLNPVPRGDPLQEVYAFVPRRCDDTEIPPRLDR
jgi:hypothetical protein